MRALPHAFALALALVVSAATGACAKPATVRAPETAEDPAAVSRFLSVEGQILADLAAIDRRLAARVGHTPSDDDLRRVAMAAIMSEDASTAVVDGAIDAFSFGARARGLDAAKRKLDAAPAASAAVAQERALLSRLLEAEILRVEDERRLPRSASDLVRAIVATWTPPESLALVGERDTWLARRLSEVRDSLAAPGAALDTTRARELDDALDDVEALTREAPFKKATPELVKLRDALESSGGPHVPVGWESVRAHLRVHFGVDAASPKDLAAELEAAEATTREAAGKVALYGESEKDALAAQMQEVLFSRAPCRMPVAGSRVRSLFAPPERTPLCHIVVSLAAKPEVSTALAVAMHTYVTVGLWALELATREARVSEASARHGLLYPPTTSVHARAERLALARPTTAIGTAVGVAMLLRAAGGAPEGARRWVTLGDAPLDVTSAAMAPGPQRPASPPR
jgi:hypothetical protein